MFLKTLSGRFLILTALFVMLAEILIFVPSVARFREDYIRSRLERAQIASLSLLAAGDMIDEKVEGELLANAEVYNVVLRRDEARQLVLSSPIRQTIEATYDMRDPSAWELIRDAIHCLLEPDNRVMRVIGDPVKQAGMLIEVTMDTAPLRAAMIDYGVRILGLSAVISVLTAGLLFLAVGRLLVAPIRRVVSHMSSYAEAPEDARRVIEPQSDVVELREAEEALQGLQKQLTSALRQKERLAQLGGAVARISHDLRNILTTAQLMSDRIEMSKDPTVARAAPKLIAAIGRAVSLCESTLAFGKAEEPPPTLARFMLSGLVEEIVEGERIAGNGLVDYVTDIAPALTMRADREQLYRVLSNLTRNARQAIEATGQPGTIEIGAGEEEGGWWIRVGDTGPGLPQKTREHLFEPFHAGNRKGGTGLGLAIAAELIRGHGGRLELVRSDENGTEFMAHLPRELSFSDPQ
ncbi:HAMP domain-containing sensor histidine kinase [Frigidibacter sp. RF13]|uniref:sensor histidine kinase n=1 Tax=Frigidibacter sp. RF13 TaxID=2997340 RepID=UPI002271A69C|nr:HAMP domain-containing sensor histidine kinase [Frigidibacter sp. RF13]MCY1127429.1 HAMP domain-containing sensor histidine kinase [Frigidibacter sp. RF13]